MILDSPDERCPFMAFIAIKWKLEFHGMEDKLNFRFNKKNSRNTLALRRATIIESLNFYETRRDRDFVLTVKCHLLFYSQEIFLLFTDNCRCHTARSVVEQQRYHFQQPSSLREEHLIRDHYLYQMGNPE